jgi:hypothetical protein
MAWYGCMRASHAQITMNACIRVRLRWHGCVALVQEEEKLHVCCLLRFVSVT